MLGNFEIKLRSFILNRIKEYSKEEPDYEQLFGRRIFEKVESRKNQESDSGFKPDKEFLDYLDLLDYKELVLKNWEVFSIIFTRKEVSKELFDYGLEEINRIRRKLMHLREIRKNEHMLIKHFVIPPFERLFS